MAGEEVSMRSMHPDTEYYAFLDELRDKGEVSTAMAPIALMGEFPNLLAEEARAVCADWRATYHERRARPARSSGI